MTQVPCGDCMCCDGQASTQGCYANASATDEFDLDLAREAKLCCARNSLMTLLEQQELFKATLLSTLKELDRPDIGCAAHGQTELKRSDEDYECTRKVPCQMGTLLSPHPLQHTRESFNEAVEKAPSIAAYGSPQVSSPRSAPVQEADSFTAMARQTTRCVTLSDHIEAVPSVATSSADVQGVACAEFSNDLSAIICVASSYSSSACDPRDTSCLNSDRRHLRSLVKRMSTSGTADVIMGVRRSLGREGSASRHGGAWVGTRQACDVAVRSPCFRYLVFTVTLMNALCLGIEAQWSLEPLMRNKWPLGVDAGFVLFFMIEFIMRLAADDWRNFAKSWLVLDLLLVGIDVARGLILLLDHEPETMQALMMALRTLRLLRLLRVLRLVHSLKQVLLLLYGVFTSGSTVISTFTILALLLYIWAILGVELITCNQELRTHPTTARIVGEHFGSLQSCLLTLVQFVSMDAMAAIYSPLIKNKPHLALYFWGVFFSVSVLLMNLINSVLIRATLENAEADKVAKKHVLHAELKQSLPVLEEVFEAMDTDNDGFLTASEFDQFPMELIPRKFWIPFSVSSMQDIFQMLDVDCSGALSQQEFVHGISSLFLVGTPIEHIRSMSLTKMASKQMQRLENMVECMREDVQNLSAPVQNPQPLCQLDSCA